MMDSVYELAALVRQEYQKHRRPLLEPLETDDGLVFHHSFFCASSARPEETAHMVIFIRLLTSGVDIRSAPIPYAAHSHEQVPALLEKLNRTYPMVKFSARDHAICAGISPKSQAAEDIYQAETAFTQVWKEAYPMIAEVL